MFYLTSKTSMSVSSDIQTREGKKNKQVTIEMKPLLKYFCLGLFVKGYSFFRVLGQFYPTAFKSEGMTKRYLLTFISSVVAILPSVSGMARKSC